MAVTLRTLTCLGPHGFHRLSYAEWAGPAEGRVTICLHGLSRNGRDFDRLAERLSERGRVLAPDMPGRGQSEWLPNPADYAFPTYFADVAALIARSGAAEVDYVGTSMGGLIGMYLAAQPGTPIRRLVLNDIGPVVPRTATERIGTYVGRVPEFDTVAEVETYLREVQVGMGRLTDDDWRHLAEHGYRRLENGKLALAYDPAIAAAFQVETPAVVDLWPFYDAVRCPTLVIHGALSDTLLAGTAQEMTRRGPGAQLYTVADAGHAPALMDAAQIDAIERFLTAETP
ncbi:MAG TPA: alpha/beta hydrolase [Stellaceae bacterium]|nr:alpha/beta hydrolase [Stellaceae bacterium]